MARERKSGMEYFKSKLAVVVLALVLCLNPAAVFAADTVDTETNGYVSEDEITEAMLAGYMLTSIMELIESEYAGGEVSYEQLYNGAINGMMETLDPYSTYMTEEEYNAFLSSMSVSNFMFGIAFAENSSGDIVISSILEGSSAIEAGLKVGDVFISANGKSVSGLTLTEAIAAMYDYTGEVSNAVFSRNGNMLRVSLTLRELENTTIYIRKLDEAFDFVQANEHNDIRIVTITTIGEGTPDELEAAILKMKAQGVKKIILDLRGNPGGYFYESMDICELLVSKGPILTYVASDNSRTVYSSTLEKRPFEEVVVLTDNNTASSAEIIASCLQDDGSKVIGQRSYGKGVIQQVYGVPTGGVIKLTAAEYYSRSGKKINEIGITPDIPVDIPDYMPPTIKTETKDIITMKKILSFCGFDTGSSDSTLDDKTKRVIKEFKTLTGLSKDSEIDVYFKIMLNDYYDEIFYSNDVILEEAYSYLTGVK